MTIDKQIEALQNEFSVLWDKAMKLHDESENRALEAIKTAVQDVQDQLDALEEDRYTAQFDANWDRIADNH
jgi:F0F1-type ATP synthase epsilon subunit